MAKVKRKKKAKKKVMRIKAKSGPGPFGGNEVEGQFNLDPDLAISADATSRIDTSVAPAKKGDRSLDEGIVEGSGKVRKANISADSHSVGYGRRKKKVRRKKKRK